MELYNCRGEKDLPFYILVTRGKEDIVRLLKIFSLEYVQIVNILLNGGVLRNLCLLEEGEGAVWSSMDGRNCCGR